MSIAQRLRQAIAVRGYGVNEVDRLAGFKNQGPTSKIQSGRTKSPTPEVVDAIARALNITPGWLTYGTGSMDDPYPGNSPSPVTLATEPTEDPGPDIDTPETADQLVDVALGRLPNWRDIRTRAAKGRPDIPRHIWDHVALHTPCSLIGVVNVSTVTKIALAVMDTIDDPPVGVTVGKTTRIV
jgi:hypothetical protein